MQSYVAPYLTRMGEMWRAKSEGSVVGDSSEQDKASLEPGGAHANVSSDEVRDIWAELLNTEDVEPSDNFFALGGQSLLATKMVARVRERLAVRSPPFQVVFSSPTRESFTQRVIAMEQAAAPSIALIGRTVPLVPSFAQQRLWFLSQMEGVSEAYHIWFGSRLGRVCWMRPR